MKRSLLGLVFFVTTLGILAWGFWDGLAWNVNSWAREEYSHSYLIPFITLYLVWQKIADGGRLPVSGSWFGLLLLLFGLLVLFIGEFSTLYPVIGYGFVFTVWGVLWTWLGTSTFKRLFPAFALLIFTVPLPSFIFNNLSSQLQLISSQLGVAFIRLFDISVYIEGNVIDLGEMKLQVVEACSGLRYLFPLMTLAFIMAMLFRAPRWKKLLLFVSSFPVTVLMNSIRIGAIGVLVEYYGVGMAEGFLHDFEGWVIFMAALGVLVVEMWLLARLGNAGGAEENVEEESKAKSPIQNTGKIAGGVTVLPILVSVLMAVPVAVGSSFIDERSELVPEREIFANFPLKIRGWEVKRELMDALYVDELDFDDYIMANYSSSDEVRPINFYVAWYDSQRKGESAHSPKTCLPGGGWRIEDFGQSNFARGNGKDDMSYNRVVINKQGNRQLVYYWFQQRGRNLTNEYLVKWYLFWDSVTINRTDGALIRLTTYVDQAESLVAADEKLEELMSELVPVLPGFLGE